MADITMCTQVLCPNAGRCYRVQAQPGYWQSMQAFEYTIGVNGVVCVNYLPMYGATTSNTTKPNTGIKGAP